jgi:pimeloyl-ACP methyl ester carboxylesterase
MRQYTFGPHASEELFEFVFRILADPSTEAVVRRLRGMLHYEGAEEAKRITCPALVLAGEVDRTFDPEMSHELRRLIPDSELALLPGCGHLPQLEAPELFNPTLRRFLDGVDARASATG